MVTTDPAGPPRESRSAAPSSNVGFWRWDLFVLPEVTWLVGGRAGIGTLGLCESRGPQVGSEVHKSASLLRSYR